MTKQETETIRTILSIGFNCQFRPKKWWLRLVRSLDLILCKHSTQSDIYIACTFQMLKQKPRMIGEVVEVREVLKELYPED